MSRTIPFALLGIAALLTAPGCSRFEGRDADGPGAAQDARDWAALADFTTIDVTGPDNVEATIGKTFSVRAEGDAKVIQRLDIRKLGDRLSIGRHEGSGSFWGDNGDATIHVTMPAIAAVDITGSGNVKLDRAEGPSLKLSLTGSGDAVIAAVSIGDLRADVTGSGNIALAGAAKTARLSVTGSGDIDADGLKVDKGVVRVMGSGNVGFASDGTVAITVMGSGDVTVKGKAQCSKDGMGSGEVHCGS